MAHRVITVSRSLGAGGEEVGRMVAQALSFRYADEEIISNAAAKAGVSPETIAQVERTPGLIRRILESMVSAPIGPEGLQAYAAWPATESASYQALIENVIRETASQGNVVIVAHGTGIPLAGMDGLLRVLVTASPAVRVERLVRGANLDDREARKAVEDSDRQRREYLRRFYQVSEELPIHYDLVVNTDLVSLPQAARVVVGAARG